MTRRVTLDLARLLPGVPEGDACVDRLAQALRSRPGISLAAKDRDGATAALAVTFEDRDISEADVVEAARRAAARLMAAFRHEQLRLGGLDCDECARAIEHVMARVDGIRSVAVDYPSETLSVEYEAAHLRRPQIRRRIEALGYTVEEGRSLSSWLREHRHLVRAAVAGAMALAARALEPAGIPSTWGYAAACVAAGWPTAVEAVSSLRQRRLYVDLLMLLAAVGAAATGQLAEGAVLLVLFAFGHALEHEAEGRARGAIGALGRLAPRFARRLDPRGESTDVLVHALARGDRVLLRPGERIPVDGEVLRGESLVDESAVTGESTPVAKGPGAPVFAGTLNGDGTLEVAVTRLSSESTIARMTRLVEEARSSAAPAEQAARRLAGVLVPTVLAGAAAVATLPPLLGWLPWQESLYRAMALLVAASPCALAIGPPVAGVAALARAARHGILVKGAAHLEAAARLRAIAFDKTGTLTQGRPVVEAIEVFPGGPVDGAPGLLAWAAAAESSSTHPLAASVVAAARAHGIDWPTPSQVTAYPGRGVEAVVEGRCIRVGTAQWAAPSSASERAGSRHDLPAGTTEVIVSVDGRPAGALYLSDPLRPEAAEAVASLKALGLVHTALLSGDRAEVARRIGAAVGIDEVHAPLMPEEKLRALAVLEHRFGAVAMVGDGVNDGPALAAATVGIAMGAAGSDVALEAAPAALLGTDLRLLARLVRLARATRRILVQDLALAMGVIAVLSAAAVTGYAGIGPAVAIHEASTVVVALNGLRLLGPGGLPQPSRLRTPVSRTSPTGFIR